MNYRKKSNHAPKESNHLGTHPKHINVDNCTQKLYMDKIISSIRTCITIQESKPFEIFALNNQLQINSIFLKKENYPLLKIKKTTTHKQKRLEVKCATALINCK